MDCIIGVVRDVHIFGTAGLLVKARTSSARIKTAPFVGFLHTSYRVDSNVHFLVFLDNVYAPKDYRAQSALGAVFAILVVVHSDPNHVAPPLDCAILRRPMRKPSSVNRLVLQITLDFLQIG